MLTRRGFLTTVAALVVAPALPALLRVPPPPIGYINRTTCVWWRNRGHLSLDEIHRITLANYRGTLEDHCFRSSVFYEQMLVSTPRTLGVISSLDA
jgi:hypothetical protein